MVVSTTMTGLDWQDKNHGLSAGILCVPLPPLNPLGYYDRMSVKWQDSGRGQLYTIKTQQMILLIKKETESWRSRSKRNVRYWPHPPYSGRPDENHDRLWAEFTTRTSPVGSTCGNCRSRQTSWEARSWSGEMPGWMTFGPTVLQTACNVHWLRCNSMRGQFPLTAVNYSLMTNGKVPVRSMETCRPNRGMTPIIRNLGIRWRWVTSFRTRATWPPYGTGWAPRAGLDDLVMSCPWRTAQPTD